MKRLLRILWREKMYWLMIMPALLFFIIFSYIPMLGVYYAFIDFDFSKGLFDSQFVGMKNFLYLFAGGKNAVIWKLTRNTFLYNLAFTAVGTTCQVIVALFLYELPGKKLKKTCQSLMLLPHFISYVLVALIVYSFLSYDIGIINSALRSMGLNRINIYTNTAIWPPLLVFVNLWKGLGYGSVVYLAALVGIDKSLFEAADLDGASRFQRVWHITLPCIRPTIVILLLFGLGSIVKGQFDMFYQLIGKNGLLYDTCDIIDTFVYRSLTVNFNMGLSTAAGLYQSVIGLVMILSVNYIVKKIEPDYALF